MDAPPTQYRVIERGRKLIVLDAATNLPPKQACDIRPGGHGRRSIEEEPEPDAGRASEQAARSSARADFEARDGRESTMDGLLSGVAGKEGLNPASIGLGAFGFAMIVAIMIGGLTGFLMAAAAIIIAGNIALKRYGKRR
ncbi:MAG: hypothetical protein AAFW97_00180 [Pseudomonadota bacterium]